MEEGATRGTKIEVVLDVYKNGIKYWSPSKEQYIIVKDRIGLPLDKAGSGKITTVLDGMTDTAINELIIK